MDYPINSTSRGLVSTLVVLALAVGPSTGCSDDVPSSDGTQGSSTGGGSTGPAPTTTPSADTTDGTTVGSTTAPATSSSSGDPDGTGTTQGASASDSSGGTTDGTTDGGTTTEGSTTEGSTTEGSTTDPSGSSSDSGGMVLPDVSGEFLFALATSIDPSLPLQYIATFDFVAGGMGGGTVDVELQPLALDLGSSTAPRTPFGPPMVFGGIPVADDGTFSINVGGLVIAGETNPITGSDASANNVVLDVQILDADELCGTASGTLTNPIMIPLGGTTFGAVRVADVMPAALPVVFPVAC